MIEVRGDHGLIGYIDLSERQVVLSTIQLRARDLDDNSYVELRVGKRVDRGGKVVTIAFSGSLTARELTEYLHFREAPARCTSLPEVEQTLDQRQHSIARD